MTATRLLVLGAMRAFEQAHGYQVRRELLGWGVQYWANVKPGSVYHALRQLAKTGMVHSAGVEGSNEGPERVLYEFTEQGEEEFFRLLRTALSDSDAKPEFFSAGITFMPALDRGTVVSLLQFRLARLEASRAELVEWTEGEGIAGKPAHIWELFQWWRYDMQADCDFTRDMLRRVEGGAYELADDVAVPFGVGPGSGGGGP